MEFIKTDFEGAYLTKPIVHGDHRGFFLESYSQAAFEKAGLNIPFVQDNHSKSKHRGVLRGLHFQKPPVAQTKLVRVTQGAILDVIVDIRKSSPTFGQWRAFELTAQNFLMLLVPQGFAHGFCTLEEDTEVQYKVDSLYSPEHDAGIRWNDPYLNIQWPTVNPVLSAKDSALPYFQEITSPF